MEKHLYSEMVFDKLAINWLGRIESEHYSNECVQKCR